jgi:hypothetical protein
MNKAKIISELENMVVARLFGRQPWLADRETYSAVKRKLIQMGLVEQVRDEPFNRELIQMGFDEPLNHKLIQRGLVEQVGDEPLTTWQITPLGKELDVDLFEVFMGIKWKCDVPIILAEHGLLNESEFDAILEYMSDANADLSGYVKRAYFNYCQANKFLH